MGVQAKHLEWKRYFALRRKRRQGKERWLPEVRVEGTGVRLTATLNNVA